MRIEIGGWESNGLRCPDVDVRLVVDGKIPSVALVQMPNGTGKTTTLEMLNATLSGTASDWKPEKVKSYRRAGESHARGRFRATLLVDGKPLTIELILNFETGQVSYKTTSPGSGGVVPRWHVPPSINRFLRPEFLGLFIFDGEFAGRLLDGNQAEADHVVDALCQLYLLDEISDFSREYWRRYSKTHSTKTSSGLSKLELQRNRLAVRERAVIVAHRDAKAQMESLDREILELKQKIESRLGRVEATRKRSEHAERQRLASASEVRAANGSLMSAMRLPHAIHPSISQRLTDLRDNLDRLKLPENTSAQFFRELVDDDECICGRPMTTEAVQQIRDRANRYLDADDAGLINALKRDIEQFVVGSDDSDDDSGYARVVRLSEALRLAVRQEIEARQEGRALMQQLIEQGDDELADWQSPCWYANGPIGRAP